MTKGLSLPPMPGYGLLHILLSKNAEASEQRVQRVLHKLAIPWAVLIDCLSLNAVLTVQD